MPSGRIESLQREFTVLSETDLRTPEQFNELIVKEANGYLVRLADVGHAELGAAGRAPASCASTASRRSRSASSSRRPPTRSKSPKGCSKLLPEIRAVAARRHGGEDRARPARCSSPSRSRTSTDTIGEAIVLVVLIIFLFLRSFRATLIPLVTIPVSLIGAFALMYVLGFSINTLTLLALVLAIGLVVDDAIVMLENIYRHVEEGMPPVKAALLGSREISFAIVAMTITLAAVYAPIGFMTGLTGRLFTEFAWTLAGAVIVSGFVALTLSPMMCSKLLRHQSHHNLFYRIIERFLNGITAGYRALLRGRAGGASARAAVGLGVALRQLFPLHHAEGRAGPGRGPGQHHHRVPRAGRRHHRVHRRLCQQTRGDRDCTCPRPTACSSCRATRPYRKAA